jgi:hypothetical protein
MSSLLELLAYGARDNYLTGDPKITFFKVIYRKKSETINNEQIEYLKSQIKLNDINSMIKLAEHYSNINNYTKMLKYYKLYVRNIDIDKLEEIINMCKTKKYIKEFGELVDSCLDMLNNENIADECPLCYDGCGKYKTACCNQFVHYNCLHLCKSCPFCRDSIFL